MLAKLDAFKNHFNVLIVDDDEDDVFVMCNSIQAREGEYPFAINKRVAHDGAAGLNIASTLVGTNLQPDLMLLDLNMPRVDGFEVLRQMRRDPALSNMPVVVMTTASDEDTHSLAKSLGAAAVVTKPRSQEDFDNIIGEVFNTWLV